MASFASVKTSTLSPFRLPKKQHFVPLHDFSCSRGTHCFSSVDKEHSCGISFICNSLRKKHLYRGSSLRTHFQQDRKTVPLKSAQCKTHKCSVVNCLVSNDAYSQESSNLQNRVSAALSETTGLQDGDISVEGTSIDKREEKKPKKFKNKYLGLVRLGSIIDNAVESFFKSEIRKRLFITAILVIASRVGYFIPLPGFDRRLIPEDYLGFVSGSVEELGDLSGELKLPLFQLGIGPYIFASIIMQVLCHVVPALVELRKEGLDGSEKIKSYIWRLSLAAAILESLIISFISLPYSIYSASYRYMHVVVTTVLLTLGSTTMIWICEKISESGFGHGTSLIVCVNILIGYSDTLYKMVTRFSSTGVNSLPYVVLFLGVFIIVTMWAIIVTEGVRKVKLKYYASRLAPKVREGTSLSEVEPYIPFNINPAGMQPVLTTTYVLAIPGIIASLINSPFWARARDMLNPTTATGFKPWLYYSVNAFFIFSFNLLDIANLPKEMSDYIGKMGARIPDIKPGRATIEYLTKIQASTRFWGGLLLSLLATISTMVDHHFRHINGLSIGFTSILIIVGSIIELRRSYQAYSVMPTLRKVLRRYGV